MLSYHENKNLDLILDLIYLVLKAQQIEER